MNYEPKPGTVAFRALAHMELVHKGSEITSARLCEAIGAAGNALSASLEPAIAAGMIFCRQKDAHPRSPLFWSLVDHTKDQPAPPAPPAGAIDVPQFLPRSVVARLNKREAEAQAPFVPSMVGGYVEAIERAVPPDPISPVQQLHQIEEDESLLVGGAGPAWKPPVDADMRVALWSNGTLEVRRSTVGGAADLVLFSRAEARAIVDYLNAIDLEVLEDEA